MIARVSQYSADVDAPPVVPADLPAGAAGLLVLREQSESRILAVTFWNDTDTGATATRPATNGVGLFTFVDVDQYEVAIMVGVLGGRTARVVSATLRPGNVDVTIGLFQNAVMHSATAQHGFRRGLLFVDRDQDRVLSIGIWESAEHMLDSERRGYLGKQVERFTEILATPPVFRQMDVVTET